MWDVQMGGVWAEHIHKSFHRVGLEESYILKEKVVIEVIKEAAFQRFREKWAVEIWNRPQLRT